MRYLYCSPLDPFHHSYYQISSFFYTSFTTFQNLAFFSYLLLFSQYIFDSLEISKCEICFLLEITFIIEASVCLFFTSFDLTKIVVKMFSYIKMCSYAALMRIVKILCIYNKTKTIVKEDDVIYFSNSSARWRLLFDLKLAYWRFLSFFVCLL